MNSTKGDNTPANTLEEKRIGVILTELVNKNRKPPLRKEQDIVGLGQVEQYIETLISQAVNKARIEEMKMMRDLIHLFKVNPIEQMQGKTSFNEYIKKRLGELETPNQVEGEK